jgi:hypothetical protein
MGTMTLRDTVVGAPPDDAPASSSPHSDRAPTPRWVGPMLIVAAVVIVLHAFAFGGLITPVDLRRLWLPMYCFLGRGLRSASVPGWAPNVFSGTPFAADPQSGWMNLSAMGLFTALPCAAAIRWMVVLQPIIGGVALGVYLRGEECARAAAATAGVVLALAVAGAELSTSLPFAGVLAWTAAALALCGRYVRARTWPSRLAWCAAAAIAWGQIAAAHFSTGLVIGTMLIAASLAASPWRRAGEDGTAPRRAAIIGRVGLLAASAVALNLAFLLPRIALVPETSLGQGYAALDALNRQIAGLPAGPAALGGAGGPAWPLKLATSGGAYLGAVALALSFAGAWNPRHRRLWIAFAAAAVLTYLLSLHAAAAAVPAAIRSWRIVGVYLHSPEWFGYGTVFALAVLSGLGVEAWLRRRAAPNRLTMLLPGVLVWLVLPTALGAGLRAVALVWVGAAAGAAVLLLALRRPGLAWLIPAALAVELVINGLTGDPLAPMPFGPVPKLLRALPAATVDPAADLRPDALTRSLAAAGGRSMTVIPGDPDADTAADDGALFPDRALLFDVESTGGYNAVQLLRTWIFVRAVQERSIRYNRATFTSAPPLALDLLDVHALVRPAAGTGSSGTPPAGAVADGLSVSMVPDPTARASLLTSWQVIGGDPRPYPNRARDAILAPGFDPERTIVLEREPGVRASSGRAGSVAYRSLGDGAARIDVDAPEGGVVLIRTPWERGWHATVDGASATLLRADYFLQAVAVPPGRHVIALSYDDPAVGYGLAGSAVAAAAMAAAAAVTARRRRRRGSAAASGSEDPS